MMFHGLLASRLRSRDRVSIYWLGFVILNVNLVTVGQNIKGSLCNMSRLTAVVRRIPLYVMISSSLPFGEYPRISVCVQLQCISLRWNKPPPLAQFPYRLGVLYFPVSLVLRPENRRGNILWNNGLSAGPQQTMVARLTSIMLRVSPKEFLES